MLNFAFLQMSEFTAFSLIFRTIQIVRVVLFLTYFRPFRAIGTTKLFRRGPHYRTKAQRRHRRLSGTDRHQKKREMGAREAHSFDRKSAASAWLKKRMKDTFVVCSRLGVTGEGRKRDRRPTLQELEALLIMFG